MMDLRVVPDPVLRQISAPVQAFGPDLVALADRMREVMYAHRGIGLAAPQVGVLTRLVLVQMDGEAIAIANPVVDWGRGNSLMEEGCLSCPGVLVRVRRSAMVLVEGQRCDGSPTSYSFDKVLAHCIQHEIDHLDGRLILDHGPALPASPSLRPI